MSLDFYLKLKNQYNLLIFSIDEIICNYREIINISYNERLQSNNKEEVTNFISNCINIKNVYQKHKENIQVMQRETDIKIANMCNHEYIRDTIDIDPDRSREIYYCKICGITK